MAPTDLSFARQVDAACDRFEAAWRAGKNSRIEDFLGTATGGDRAGLLTALIAVEVELRRAAGEEVKAGPYRQRFAADADAVALAFTEQGRARVAGDTSVSRESVKMVVFEGKTDTAQPALTDIPKRIGRFAVTGVLGAGAFGRVYRAKDPQLGRDVAIKVPLPATVGTTADRERFLREARAAAALHHPNICPVHEVGEENGHPYIVMGFVPGQSLAATLKVRKEPLAPKQAALIARKLALALDAAHKKGIVHRDLKAANVMFDKERRDVVVTDFGLARAPRMGNDQTTRDGVLMGTPAYMSPEQARGDTKAVGPASDQYSLGVMLYEMLTGRRPFTGTITEVLGKILHVEPESPTMLCPGLDPGLAAACMKAMAKDPAARFASMRQFADAMTGFTSDAPAARPAAPVSPSAETARETTETQRIAEVFAFTEQAVENAIRKHRTPTWMKVGLGILILIGLVVPGILFFARTPTAKVIIQIDVDIHDRTLAFFLDGKPMEGEALTREIELKVGKHVLEVKKNGQVIRRYEFNVSKDAGPRIELKEEEPPQQRKKELSPDEEDRKFAEWLLSIGVSNFTVSVGGGEMSIARLADLPSEPFRVTAVDPQKNNNITDRTVDPILRWIERRSIQRVIFFDDPIGDETVRRLVKLPSIKGTSLGATKITSACIPDLATRTDLLWLGLIARPINDADIEKLRGLVNLTVLELEATLVTDAGLRHLRGMKKLQVLTLQSTAVTGGGLDELADLPIERLGLGATKVRGAEGLARLKKLTELKVVDLRSLLLVDADLKPLIECKSIESLILHDNRITDAGLETLAKMKWLKHVTLNQAGGTNLVTAAGLEQLRKALPYCNVVYEAQPADPDRAAAEWAQRLKADVVVDLAGEEKRCAPTDALPRGKFKLIGVYFRGQDIEAAGGLMPLKGLARLRDLSLWDAKLTDDHLRAIEGMTTLRLLNLHAVPVTDAGMSSIATLPNLEELWLHYRPITDAGIAKLAGLKKLKRLLIRRTKVGPDGLKVIGGMTELEHLDLGGTGATDDSLAHLAGLRKLKQLDIEGTPLTGSGLKHLASLPGLAWLQIGDDAFAGTGNVTDEGLQSLPELKKLRALNIGELASRRLTGATLKVIGTLTDLEGLEISIHACTNGDLAQLKHLTQLVHLAVRCPKVTDDGLAPLAGMNRLNMLWLERTAITGAGFVHVAKLPQLLEIRAADTPLADAGLEHLTRLRTLERVYFDKTNLTDAGLEILAKIPSLRYVHVQDTAVTDAGLRKFKSARPECAIVPEPKGDPKQGFVPLFNGKDLTGWKKTGVLSGWSVNNGGSVAEAVEQGRNIGWLMTERDYADFILKLEFMTAAGTDSGVGFRCDASETSGAGQAEIQIVDEQDPELVRVLDMQPHRRTGALAAHSSLRTLARLDRGVWHNLTIEVRGRQLKALVDGTMTVDTNLNEHVEAGKKMNRRGIWMPMSTIHLPPAASAATSRHARP